MPDQQVKIAPSFRSGLNKKRFNGVTPLRSNSQCLNINLSPPRLVAASTLNLMASDKSGVVLEFLSAD